MAGCQHGVRQAGVVLVFSFSFPGAGPGVFLSSCFRSMHTSIASPGEHAVAAGDALPQAGGTRLGRGDRRLRAGAGHVVVGHGPRMVMDRGVRCAAGAEFAGRP
jgi:hypothetical protein